MKRGKLFTVASFSQQFISLKINSKAKEDLMFLNYADIMQHFINITQTLIKFSYQI